MVLLAKTGANTRHSNGAPKKVNSLALILIKVCVILVSIVNFFTMGFMEISRFGGGGP